MAGWFIVDRDISTHWIWTEAEPFDSRSAWIDLLMLANFRDIKVMRKGKLVVRKRGDVNTSTRFLAERWRWSRNRVMRFLRNLESDKMVSLNGTTDGTTITIENYGKYQLLPTTCGATDETTGEATDGATGEATDGANENKGINKGINKGKNKGRNIYRDFPDDLRKTLMDFEEMRKLIKAPLTERARTMLLNRLEELSGGDTQIKIAILEQSIMKSWKGVFPLEKERGYDRRRSENEYRNGTETAGSDWSDFG